MADRPALEIDRFFSLPLEELRPATTPGFSLYIQHEGGGVIRYRAAGQEWTDDLVAQLTASGISRMLVAKSDRAAYLDYLDRNADCSDGEREERETLELILDSDRGGGVAERAGRLLEASRGLVRDAFRDSPAPALRRRLKAGSRVAARFLLSDKAAFGALVEQLLLDPDLLSHSINMAVYAAELGRAAGRDTPDQVAAMHLAGLLHDVGKLEIEPLVLEKPGPLSEEEWEIVRRHPRQGVRRLERTGWGDSVAVDVCLSHHESWDGSGYPQGRTSERIPLEARIAAVCDSFDALTCERPWRPSRSGFEALQEMRVDRGKKFDPRLFDLFVRTLGR